MYLLVHDIPIKRIKETKYLEFLLTSFYRGKSMHIDKIAKKISSAFGAIRKLKSCVDNNTLICAYNALDYYCEVWDNIHATLSDRLQELQNTGDS